MSLLLLLGGGGIGTPPPPPTPVSAPRLIDKTYRYEVFSDLAATTKVGEFPADASKGHFSEDDQGGAQALTITYAGSVGDMGEAGETSGRPAILVAGYLVRYRVTSTWSLMANDPTTLSVVRYAGTIEKWDVQAGRVTVSVSPLTRLWEETFLDGEVTNVGGSAGANALITTYCPALTWDGTSPSFGAGVPQTFKNQTVKSAIEQIAKSMGADVVAFVTATGSVRFYQQSRGSAGAGGASSSLRHTLRVGAEIIGNPRLGHDNTRRVKKVYVVWAGSPNQTATSGTYSSSDPRELMVAAPEITSSADAATLATNILADRDRLLLSGEITVSGKLYDVDKIRPGDAVRIQLDRLLGTGTGGAGTSDHNDADVVVRSVDYDFDTVTLHVDSPLMTVEGLIKDALNNIEYLAARWGDVALKRTGATALSTNGNDFAAAAVTASTTLGVTGNATITGALIGNGGVRTKTKAGTPTDSDVTSPADGAMVADTSGNLLWVRVGGVWKSATLT